MTLPAGFHRSVVLTSLKGNRYSMEGGGVLSGVYERRGDRLVVVEPNDKRMRGLVWEWDGEQLKLASEPPSRPTGSSYVGAVMQKASTD